MHRSLQNSRTGHSHRLLFLIALALVVSSLGAAAQTGVPVSVEGNQLSIVSRQVTVGTHRTRASVIQHDVPGWLRDRVSARIEKLVASCAATDVRLVIRDDSRRDFVGGTSTSLGGVGLYLSLPEASVSGIGNYYVAPFLAIKASLQRPSHESLNIDVSDFQIFPLKSDELGSRNFFEISAKDAQEIIGPFVDSTVEKHLSAPILRVCQERS